MLQCPLMRYQSTSNWMLDMLCRRVWGHCSMAATVTRLRPSSLLVESTCRCMIDGSMTGIQSTLLPHIHNGARLGTAPAVLHLATDVAAFASRSAFLCSSTACQVMSWPSSTPGINLTGGSGQRARDQHCAERCAKWRCVNYSTWTPCLRLRTHWA